ncbi:MAG: HepT-like ribonuclease domain-containing protein [Saprospiraceae bacterium]
MQSKLGDKIRLQHIQDAIEEIESYLIKKDFEDFMNNSMMRFACIKQIEIIGEASNQVSVENKTKFSEIEVGSDYWNEKCTDS